MRRLVTLQNITDLNPVPDADRIEVATIGGWQVVVRKSEFLVGDLCIYFEVDSMLPLADSRFSFLTHPRLKTRKIRGQISQGLALPANRFQLEISTGLNLAEQLGVTAYEPPVTYANDIIGPWNYAYSQKTNSTRVQNVPYMISEGRLLNSFATEKIDGTSGTLIHDLDTDLYLIYSKNYQVPENSLWGAAVNHYDLRGVLDRMPIPDGASSTGIQFEVYGPKIQGNPLRRQTHRIAIFKRVMDGSPYCTLPPTPFNVPVLNLQPPSTVAEAVAQADGLRSAINPEVQAEGIVWHGSHPPVKALNNTNLLLNQ